MKLYKILFIRFLLFLGQRTFIGRGQLRKIIIKFIKIIIFFNKNKNFNSGRKDFTVSILGVPFIFFIDEKIGYKFYFLRNERKEVFFINNNTKENTIFFDIGANMGMYTQIVASNFDKIKNSIIVAIEPDPLNCFRIKENLKLLVNRIPNIFDLVKIEECAVGESNKKIFLDRSDGPAQGKIVNFFKNGSIKVQMRTLNDVIERNKITHITNLKIDIEGYEDKCLLDFFNNASKKMYPENIVIEDTLSAMWSSNIVDHLKFIGYKLLYRTRANLILRLK
jgi:FkbM family methyltransferase